MAQCLVLGEKNITCLTIVLSLLQAFYLARKLILYLIKIRTFILHFIKCYHIVFSLMPTIIPYRTDESFSFNRWNAYDILMNAFGELPKRLKGTVSKTVRRASVRGFKSLILRHHKTRLPMIPAVLFFFPVSFCYSD